VLTAVLKNPVRMANKEVNVSPA
jgi:hypothetical protein